MQLRKRIIERRPADLRESKTAFQIILQNLYTLSYILKPVFASLAFDSQEPVETNLPQSSDIFRKVHLPLS